MIVVALFCQCVFLGMILFGDIGFDLPGRYGLDFGHLIWFAAGFGVSWLLGMITSIRKRHWGWLGVHALMPIVGLAGVWILGL